MSNTKYLEISIPKYCENVNSEEIFVFEFFFCFSREKSSNKNVFQKISAHKQSFLIYNIELTILFTRQNTFEKSHGLCIFDIKKIFGILMFSKTINHI